MKHEDRRKEAGKMLMDITKYLITVGLIGGILTEKMTFVSGAIFVVTAIIIFIVALFTIPPKKEE
ncbi:MAG: hypothetical protein QMD44_06165 [Thermodesulfovibrionales bacterium]|jgi:hypothetical protein|nr:hypothetical protein [Thermodesulfovibrionales bacterium]